MTEAYPLYWPQGRARTDAWRRQRSKFKTGFGAAVREIMREIGLLRGRLPVISTNVPLRRDGLPLASAKRPTDPGCEALPDHMTDADFGGTHMEEAVKAVFLAMAEKSAEIKRGHPMIVMDDNSKPTVTLDDMIRDVGRELGMRRANYPRWVKAGKLTQAKADHQIACMDAIYAMLKRQKNGE